MKGQPEPLVERAILEARQQADFLYHLVVNANMAVLENGVARKRESIFLLGYLRAEMHENLTKVRVETLRSAVRMFVEVVIILDAAIAQVVLEYLAGQPVLFGDTAINLTDQLRMSTDFVTWFNKLAVEVGVAEINLAELRSSLQSEIDREIAILVSRARQEMLSTFGKTDAMHAAMEKFFLLCDPKPGKGKNGVDA